MSLRASLLSLALMTAAAMPTPAADETPAASSSGKVYELRTYTANPGRAEAMHKRFRDHTGRLFQKHGIELIGFWVPHEEKDGKADKLVYLLAYPSRDAAKASWAAFQADPEWQKVRDESHKDGVVVAKAESVYLASTDYSPAVETGKEPSKAESRVFELRTYIASPGKLEDLNKRFRDHTVSLFAKHGLHSVGYWVPLDKDKGSENTLIYLLSTPSREAAAKSWKAFGDDPEWQKVYKESQPDGVPLAGKVISLYLDPTDYSPMK